MSRVHRANLTILKEIDRICRKYKIQYALDAGILLGQCVIRGLFHGMMMQILSLREISLKQFKK